jgi:hypothetical protein
MPRELTLEIPRDAIRSANVDHAPIGRSGMLSSAVDGRTQCVSADPIPASSTFYNLETYSDGLKVYVAPGTIGGDMPTIGGDPLDDDPPPAITLSGTGNEYIVVSITGTWVNTPDGLFARQLTSRSVTIAKSTSLPSSADLLSKSSGGTFKFLLAKYVDGLFSFQNGYGPIGLYFEDDGSSSAKLNCNVGYPGTF